MSEDANTNSEMKQHEANAAPNYFETYGQSASPANIVGQLLKFNKGDWLAGSDGEDVEMGTKLVALMDDLTIGWVRWEDNKPAEQIMGKVVDGYKPPRRKELGNLEEDLWDVDDEGRPRDPWQFSNNLIFRNPGLTGSVEDEDCYTFSTSSRGGINAIGAICKIYGKAMRQRPDEYPVVTLGFDTYNHPNKKFGRIKVPVFEVVGWEKKAPEPEQKKIEPPKAKAAAVNDAKVKRRA